MSILRYFNKHQGWHEGKRTPFGGGGGGFFGGIADSIRGTMNTGLGDWTAQNGWMVPLAMATAGVASGALGAGALAADGSLAAGSAELAGPSLAGSQAFDAAIASGATTAEASAAADAAAQAAISSGQGIGTAAGGSAGAAAGSATQALPYTEAFDAVNLASQGLSQEAIVQNLTASGLNDFMASDIAQLANQGLDPDAINKVLQYSYSSQELAPLGIESLQSTLPEGTNVKDILKNANRVQKLAKAIMGSSAGKPTAQQYSQFKAANQPVQEQFGGLYRMNEKPFAQTQQAISIQNPLARTQDFLAQLAQEGKTEPTLADLLRNA